MSDSLAWVRGLPETHRAFVEDILGRPNAPRLLAGYARALARRIEQGDELRLLSDLANRAWMMSPDDPEVVELTRWAVRVAAPRWQLGLLADRRRNDAYQAAIEATVRPGDIVFEIGAGSGLLALMAARAGAGHVYSCEESPLMAEMARRVVRANGFEDRITIIPKPSQSLEPGSDLPRPPDVFVAELVDNGLLGEQLLPVMIDARERLLGPETRMLPAQVRLVGVPIGHGLLTEWLRPGEVSGFDLSAMSALAPRVFQPPSSPPVLEAVALGPAQVLFELDLAATGLPRTGRVEVACPVSGDADVGGLLTWLQLDFGSAGLLDNAPPAESAWSPLVHRFATPVWTSAGESLRVEVRHDLYHVTLEPRGAAAS